MRVNWQQLQEIFDRLCLLDEDQRREALDRHCNGNDELRREAMRLVRAYDAERAATAEANASPAGARFGAWETIRMVARGGMGEVWLARRADGEHEQRAALKILSPYLAAPDSVDRFRRERQLLARLEHPNIARLLDGGMSPRGEPYLVMEYVDGIRLDQYCDQHRLTVRQRLELTIKVCGAVNAAHQYLIVHRDLKPANILVTEDGEPKLLDFGIAKMIGAESRERTATVNQFLTPAHASPEVLRGEPATVASDVFSLGVVLYELLTGNRPFESSSALPAAEWERAVRDTAPARPSNVTEAAAGQRSTTAPRLRQMLAGDLTTILEKSLRHEPGQRYQSAERLAEDLQLYLSNRPILARPQTFRYRRRLCGPRANGHRTRRAGARSVSAAAEPQPDRVARPEPFLLRGGHGTAARPHRSGAKAHRGETRRRPAAGPDCGGPGLGGRAGPGHAGFRPGAGGTRVHGRQKVRLIELRYLMGCTVAEISEVSGLSGATVERHLRFARTWLYDRLHAGLSGGLQ